MCNRASDYAENVSPGPAENDDVADEGCLECGGKCEPGRLLCELCHADKARERAAELARQLVDDFMTLPARLHAVDDAGPAADLGLQAVTP